MTGLITEWTHASIPNFKVRPYQQQYFYETPINYIRQQMALAKQIENYTPEPAFLNASVGTGKSLAAAMMSKHVTDKGGKVIVLARQGELVEQNSDEAWGIGCRNGIYSASLNRKNKLYATLIGTEGTVANGIVKPESASKADLADWGAPDLVLIDECFVGSTMINTSDGLKRIDKLSVDDKVACFDHVSGNVKYHHPVRVFTNGIRRVSYIKTSKGDMKCTKDHRVYSIDSKKYKPVDTLNVGERMILDGSKDFVMIKLLRASAAVASLLKSKTIRALSKALEIG